MEQDLLLKERADLCQVFQYHIEQIPVTDSFHLYLVDCRGEKTLKDTIVRIDKLMKNKHLKAKDTVMLPVIFGEVVEEVGRDNFENIDPIVTPDYRCNFMTGMRKEPSKFVTGLDHYLGWTGIIASPVLKNMTPKPRVFEHYFHNCRQLMEGYVPKDENVFMAKLKSIATEGKTIEQKCELEQLFAMAAIVRPEVHKKFVMLYEELIKGFGIISTDVKDFTAYNHLIIGETK